MTCRPMLVTQSGGRCDLVQLWLSLLGWGAVEDHSPAPQEVVILAAPAVVP